MIPLVDLKAQYNSIKDEINEAVIQTLESTQFVLGKAVASFEESFAGYMNVEHAVAVNSGTSSLHLAFLAADIQPGDEVITTPMTFIATVAAIRYTGAVPVFVDCDPKTYTIDPSQIEAKITSKTKAICPVHLYGQAAEMDAILDIAGRNSLKVIEDAAQAHGAEYKGKRVSGLGDIGCFSFYPGKNLGAYGEGGMVVTNDAGLAKKVRLMRDWGAEKKHHHDIIGFNYRMDGVQGAILGVKMKYIEEWTELRRQHAKKYDELLADVNEVTMPHTGASNRHVYHIYAVQVENRDQVIQKLWDNGIGAGMHYPVPVHLAGAHSDLGYKQGNFPVTELLSSREISLPLFPEMTDEQIVQVVETLKKCLV